MKSILIFFLLQSCLNPSFSQDNSIYRAKYNFSWQKDSTNSSSKYSDIMNLDIGKVQSIYYSALKQLGIKNGMEDVKNRVPLETIMQNAGKYFALSETEIIKINYSNKELAGSDKFSNKCYFYNEKLDVPDWKIEPDTLTILNQLCQKATTTFRGRNYIAWFANSIPYHLGPWLFTGLPGLILKINDDKNQLNFECKQLSEISSNELAYQDYDGCIETTYEKLKQLKKLATSDPMEFSKVDYPGLTITVRNRDGNVVAAKHKLLPYNPIDLSK